MSLSQKYTLTHWVAIYTFKHCRLVFFMYYVSEYIPDSVSCAWNYIQNVWRHAFQ